MASMSTMSLPMPFSGEPFPCRIGLTRKDGDNIQNGANEIFMISPAALDTRRGLVDQVKTHFHSLEKRPQSDRVNVPDRCFWGADYDAERVKVTWDPVNTYGASSWAPGTSMNETEITDANLKTMLHALKLSPPSTCVMSLLITHSVPLDLVSRGHANHGY
ncbi:uncharacterized protein LY89DRAFT_688511 [Mollisia scopiformis]|uniref:Uncharacterized protein n=1 Tax=Mollisia scopiformis TaxID=149040 RepID=A0A194WWI1_MOLSC|nr:uncharacterized protein LY89DRAFT_688511 [Mollisia scopiformis]KUJ12039.1 hypothetical protein LY89DRAFT_688511 [Mollisia scopiformis]